MDRSPGQSQQPTKQPAQQPVKQLAQQQVAQQPGASSHLTTANPLSAGSTASSLNVPRLHTGEREAAADHSHGVNADERDALDRFTGPAYRELNQALRSGGKLSEQQWKDVQLLGSALEKLPKCKGIANRVLKFDDKASKDAFLSNFGKLLAHRQYATRDLLGDLDKQAKNPPADAREYVTPQFMSCKAAAMDHGVASYGSDVRADNDVRLKVLCNEKNAGDLRKLYEGRDLGEQEVLFPPNTKFQVIAASESNIYLVEMDSKPEPLDPSRKA